MEDLDHGSDEQAEQRAAEHVDPYYHVQPQSAMPNAFRFAVNAGDVCLFGARPNRPASWPGGAPRRLGSRPDMCADTCIWHTASPNDSEVARENTIIHYEANSRPAAPGVPAEVLELCDAAGLLSEERRELLAFR